MRTPSAAVIRHRLGRPGLGTMCTEHWRAYVKGLRQAWKAATATDQGGTADDSEGADAA